MAPPPPRDSSDDDDAARALRDLARLGRAREFSASAFEAALHAGERHLPRPEILRRLVQEWTGLSLSGVDATAVMTRVLAHHRLLEAAWGRPAGLLTALLHELHTVTGQLVEPRLLPERELAGLHERAATDPLTGLLNRRGMVDYATRELARADRARNYLSLLLLDLMGFKSINDGLGHPVGDEVLARTASAIRESLRAGDVAFRYGGDEFLAVLPGASLLNALPIAERIRERVTEIALPRKTDLKLGVHYGVATYPSDGATVEALVGAADQRLYECREQDASRRSHVPIRRHPRFRVSGLRFRLGRNGRSRSLEVKDIGYGGLSFLYPGPLSPRRFEGELRQKHAPSGHAVALRPTSLMPLAEGVTRVGCAFEG